MLLWRAKVRVDRYFVRSVQRRESPRHPTVRMRLIHDTERSHQQTLLLHVQSLLIDTHFDLHPVELLFLQNLQRLYWYRTGIRRQLLLRLLYRIYAALLGAHGQTFQLNRLSTIRNYSF